MNAIELKSFERKFNLVYGLVTLIIVSGFLAAAGGLHWWSFGALVILIGVWSLWG